MVGNCPSILNPVAQICAQPQGLCAGKTATPSGVTSSGWRRMYGRTLSQILSGTESTLHKFPPFNPPISICPHQTPHIPLSSFNPFPQTKSSRAMASIVASSDTPGDSTNFNFYDLRKNPHSGPSASMRKMLGLIWGPSLDVLRSSAYHDWINTG